MSNGSFDVSRFTLKTGMVYQQSETVIILGSSL